SVMSAPFTNFQGHVLPLPLPGCRGERPQRGSRTALPSNQSAEIGRRYEQLDERFVLVLRLRHSHVVRTIGQCFRQDFDDLAHAAHDCSAAPTGAGVTAAPGFRAAGAAGAVRCLATSVRTELDIWA